MYKLITLLFLVANLQGFAQTKILSKGEGELPPDFPGGNTILVVFKYSRDSVNKHLEKDIEENYMGEYRLLEEGEGLNPKDTAKARFFVKVVSRRFISGREGPELQYKMIMTDNKRNLIYSNSYSSRRYSSLFKYYFRKLEKLRVAGTK